MAKASYGGTVGKSMKAEDLARVQEHDCEKSPITLVDPEKDGETAQACVIA